MEKVASWDRPISDPFPFNRDAVQADPTTTYSCVSGRIIVSTGLSGDRSVSAMTDGALAVMVASVVATHRFPLAP